MNGTAQARQEALLAEAERLGTGDVSLSNTAARLIAQDLARFGRALEAIRDTDPVDAALDPDRARRLAAEALDATGTPEDA